MLERMMQAVGPQLQNRTHLSRTCARPIEMLRVGYVYRRLIVLGQLVHTATFILLPNRSIRNLRKSLGTARQPSNLATLDFLGNLERDTSSPTGVNLLPNPPLQTSLAAFSSSQFSRHFSFSTTLKTEPVLNI
ncbi:hypothetical protein T439DRAFT_125685 [Meredithblackwellia eburnea MCA 4105]